jgi:pseudo-rSAM protein
MHNIFYFFHYTDLKTEVQKRYLSLINENETKTIFIDFPVMEIWLKKWEKIFEQENVQFEFIIESDSHISEAETIISTFDIQNYHFRPFYNGNNFQFFQENVFVSEDDILTVKESIFGLLTKKISNPAFFGKLTVDACGNIFTNTNLPSVGNIDDLELKQIIYEQITDDNSVWLKNKYGVEPCKNCIYNLLCPPISNYDYIFNQHDLCTVKYY